MIPKSIQPINPALLAQALAGLERPPVAPAPAGSAPAPGPAVELELSALARALEKLAQSPQLDPRAMAQLVGLVQEQGELLRLIGMLAGSAGPANAEAARKLGSLIDALKGAPKTEPQPAGARPAPSPPEPAASNLAQDIQARLALSAAKLMAAVKGAFGPLLEMATATGADAAAAAKAQPAAKNTSAKTAAPPASGSCLPPQASSLLTQISSIFRQMAGLVPASPEAGAVIGEAENVASGGSDLLTQVAEDLKTLQNAGKPAEAPILKKEYIQSTLSIVKQLLSEAAPAGARPETAPLPSQPAAPPPSGPAPAPPPQPMQPSSLQPPASSVSPMDRAPVLLQVMSSLKPLMTASGLEAWGRVEPEIALLAQAAASGPAGPKIAALPAGAFSGGGSLNFEILDGPRLAAAVAELNRHGIRAEVLRVGGSRLATLRVTLAERPGAPPASGAEKGAAKSAGVPPAGGREKIPEKSAGAAPLRQMDARPEPLREAFVPLAFAVLAHARDAQASALTADPSSRPRLDQYAHPEVRPFNLQAQQDAAMIQMTAFYQTRREQAVGGLRFEPRPDEAAQPARLMLEYKPIIVLRPGQGVAFEDEPPENKVDKPDSDPVIDV